MINLLPPQYKKELREEETFRLLAIISIPVLVFFVCFSLMLFAFRTYVQGSITVQELLIESLRQESESQGNVLQELRTMNTTLLGVEQFYKTQSKPSEIIERVSLSIPQDVYVTAILFSSPLHQAVLSLRGFAPTRESLLIFKENLSRDTSLKDIEFPFSNFTNPHNFSASMKYLP